jgi:hypothetical protein
MSTATALRARALEVPRSTALAWLALAFLVLAICFVFWPGRIDIDMLGQIVQVESGDYTNLHAPLLQAIWTPLWDLGLRTGAVLLAQVSAFVAGSYLILRAAFRPLAAAGATGLIALSPPVLANLASVIRDAWFAALLVLAFGLVVRAAQRPWPVQARYLGLAIVAAWLALAARQNAAAAVALACIAITALFLAHRRASVGAAAGSRRYGLLGAIGGGILLTLALIGTQLAASAALGVRDVHPETTLLIYDLGAISEREDESLFPPELMPESDLATVEEAFTVDSMLGFVYAPPNPLGATTGYPEVRDEPAAAIRDAWWEAVTDHPGQYLSGRSTLWLRQIGLTRDALWSFPPVSLENGGFGFEFPDLYEGAMSYVEAFTSNDGPTVYDQSNGSLIFSPWIYLLAALLGALLLLRRGRDVALIVVGALAASALTYQLGLFLGAMGTRFRFEFPCVVIGMLAAAVLLRLAWGRRRARSASAS